MNGMIFNIQPFSIHDGPGIRTTIFMKGCNMRCYWCHNPESLSGKSELQFFPAKCIGCGDCVKVCPYSKDGCSARFTERCVLCGECVRNCFSEALVMSGNTYSVDELFEIIVKDKAIYERSGGGITFSGGEPLLQVDFVLEVLKKCKEAEIDTAIESALNLPWNTVERIVPYVDHFMCDLKVFDSNKHREATGLGNESILENISKLCDIHRDVLVRTPVIPEFNDNHEDIEQIAEFLSRMARPPQAELLAFHGICIGKYKSLNRKYKAEGLKTPEKAVLEELADHYKARGIIVKY